MSNLVIGSRQPTWAEIGNIVPIGMNRKVEDALEASSLNWLVEKKPMFFGENIVEAENIVSVNGSAIEPSYTAVPDRMACVANIDGKPHYLGTVSPRYEIVQNKDAFSFADYISDDISFVKSGITHTGMVYLIGELPVTKVLDDEFTPYVIFQNSFNGRYNLSACITPLRIVCQNQFAISFAQSTNKITLRHSKSIYDQLEEGKRVLCGVADYMKEISAMAEHFATIKLTHAEITHAVNMLFPIPMVDMQENAETSKLIENVKAKQETFIKMYNADDNANYRGSAWGLVNAYTDYMTHVSTKKTKYKDTSFIKTMDNFTDKIIDVVKVVA